VGRNRASPVSISGEKRKAEKKDRAAHDFKGKNRKRWGCFETSIESQNRLRESGEAIGGRRRKSTEEIE